MRKFEAMLAPQPKYLKEIKHTTCSK